jgi:hypothetical protein
MIDAKIKLHCTDNGKDVEAHILNLKKGVFLEVALNTIKLRMTYRDRVRAYVGNLAGKEFVIKEGSLPDERKEFQR